MENFVSTSENETKEIAYKLASTLNVGDIVVLTGDLGSGKTRVCKRHFIFLELRK